jgi:hypothetical protein
MDESVVGLVSAHLVVDSAPIGGQDFCVGFNGESGSLWGRVKGRGADQAILEGTGCHLGHR